MFLRSDYIYNLPEELIAQEPTDKRDESRLLVLNRNGQSYSDNHFYNFPGYLRENDVLVLNNTKVIPARILGNRPSGGKVEILLLKEKAEATWECLVRPAKRLKVGQTVDLPENKTAIILEEGEEGRRLIKFEPASDFRQWLEIAGAPPLPPYIQRQPDLEDRHRYQTVYARHDGAVAAPTAGLHFTDDILAGLENKGVNVAHITLHVGIGTFRPVTAEKITDHKMDSESFIISEEVADKINSARAKGGRLVAVGTTVVRTIESMADDKGIIRPGTGDTDIFIHPPYKFKAVDALLTNFHLPGSTLMMLVSALAGREFILNAYDHAVKEKYRFFSYGDAMFIE